MAKITPRTGVETINVKTQKAKKENAPAAWWKAQSNKEMVSGLLGTVSFLKEQQQYRYRQASLHSRLYSNYPLYGHAGANMSKVSLSSALPADRPTLNVIQSCVDTLHSRLTQAKPKPMFLTDDGNYKQRKLAKQLNNFTQGEFYQTKAYKHGSDFLRDMEILGSGVTKVLKHENRVKLERRLLTELLVDPNEAMYGHPRQLYEVQLIDRSVLMEMFPKYKNAISRAEQAFPDTSSSETISDMIMVAEGWHLKSSEDADDGKHVIAIAGVDDPLCKEDFKKDRFPFVIDNYSDRVLGFWGQGLPEQLMGTQVEINKLLMTISRSIHIMGVPRIWLEDGSKVVKSHIHNEIGMIGTFRGQPPIFQEGNSGIGADIYAQLQRLVEYAYQQSGVSALSAASQKPQGLNSGEAIRTYDDIQSDRFASLSKKYSNYYEELAYLIFDTACDIAEETGSYSTVYPNKNGAKEIDLPDLAEVKKDQFIIQCFDVSALPKEPAGRLQKITEMIQAGMIDIKEGRRLLDFPDLDQVEKLANAGEERILQILDQIVEDDKYTPPDPFMDLQLALTLSVQYYNLYAAAKLEESKAEKLRRWNTQVKALVMESQQPPPGMAGPQPMANPEPLPTSPLIPQMPSQGVA